LNEEEFRLEFPDRADFLSVARVFVSSVGVERGRLPIDRVDDLVIAVSEACTTAVELQEDGGGPQGCIRLRCLVVPGRLEVHIDYDGPSLDAEAVTVRAVDGSVSGARQSIGLSLMFALVDEAELRSTPTGTSVRLVTVG
jgi:anti-sigma regulatory factor (Ser/Thr protein kinase)